MSKLDNATRIVKEDYPTKYHDLISSLAYTLNTFMEQTTDVINGNIDFDNLDQGIISFDIVVDGSGTPIGNAIFKSTVRSPSGLQVVRAINKADSNSYVTTHPFISFTPQTNNVIIKVDNVTGLVASTVYTLTVIVIG